jgi:hypothetical protein
VSRGRIERILERAAAVRGEVRRWARSQPMVRLEQELRLFERLSRQPTFWQDRALADERARAAAAGRELSQAFVSAEKRAEAAEDLAYEAYYARQLASAELLTPELDQIDQELVGLAEGLFATLFPPRNTIALVLTTGRSGWAHLYMMGTAIERWVHARGGSTTWHQPHEVESAAAKPAADGNTPKPKKRAPKQKSWKWTQRVLSQSTPAPAAIVHVTGLPALPLLASEHGAHRFTAGGITSLVKVRFEPRPPPRYGTDDPEELEKKQPIDEVRRLWPDKRVVHDLRMNRRFESVDPQTLDLAPLLAAYLRWRVLDHGEEP